MFFQGRMEKGRKKIGKSVQNLPKIGQKWPKIDKNSKFWTILHFSLVVTNFCWYGKEMGRKFCVMLVWEGNGKEILFTVGMGRKWEGNVKYYKQGKEVGRK